MKEEDEFATNSEKKREKGNEKAGEKVTLVTHSEMKEKEVSRGG